MRTIVYNIEEDGKISVEEVWVDAKNNGNWVKVNEYCGYGNTGEECGGAPDQAIWGSVTYRWDNSLDVDVKDFALEKFKCSNNYVFFYDLLC
jgi:hypothetical protein